MQLMCYLTIIMLPNKKTLNDIQSQVDINVNAIIYLTT